MTELTRFHTSLPFDIANDRLKNARVQGVHITVKLINSDEAMFRLDLRKRTSLGITLTVAYLEGTIQQGKDGKTHISYQSHPLSRWSVILIPLVGIMVTLLLIVLMSHELAIIAGVPGIAGVLFIIFWDTLNSDFRKNDRLRLQDLVERILEKKSSMATWEA